MDIAVKLLAVIGAIALLFIVVLAVFGFAAARANTRIPSRAVLEIDFSKTIVETYPDGVVGSLLAGEALRIRDIVFALERAGGDRRVKGIIARIAGGPFSYADAQEIRDAVFRFRASGKPAIAFCETFGEAGPGNGAYYLATSFDAIYVQPSGELGITGLLSETPFFKGTLDKLSVKPQLGARGKYKTARNIFTDTAYTPEHREMNQTIIDSLLSRFIGDIASARRIDTNTARAIVAKGPLSAARALEEKLVDGLEYRDRVYELMRAKTGSRVAYFSFPDYIRRIGPPKGRGKAIALIYGNGTITQGRSGYNPLSGETVMGAQTVAAAFRAAIRDGGVGAIVFRINSPGGSYIGSDAIRREVARAREKGKPVIVTMGAVAGSGGYFVAMGASAIIAHPSTITGSIGVVGGKFALRGLYNKVGITFDRVATSPNATLWSPVEEYTKSQWEYEEAVLDTIYGDFIAKVASGRNLPPERVRELAQGRIYTGSGAVTLGLVDTLGGFPDAVAKAKSLMGVPADKPVRIKTFPKRRSLGERILGVSTSGGDDAETVFLNGGMAHIMNPPAPAPGILDRKRDLLMEWPVVW